MVYNKCKSLFLFRNIKSIVLCVENDLCFTNEMGLYCLHVYWSYLIIIFQQNDVNFACKLSQCMAVNRPITGFLWFPWQYPLWSCIFTHLCQRITTASLHLAKFSQSVSVLITNVSLSVYTWSREVDLFTRSINTSMVLTEQAMTTLKSQKEDYIIAMMDVLNNKDINTNPPPLNIT